MKIHPRTLALTLALLLAVSIGRSAAEAPGTIEVSINQSKVVPLDVRAKKVFLTRSEIARVEVLAPKQLLVNGLGVGTTSLVVFNEAGGTQTLALHVTPDVDGLREQIHGLFPKEAVQVNASGGAIVLSGEVTNEVIYDKILELAESHLPPAPPKEAAPANAASQAVNIQNASLRLPETGTSFAGGGQLAFLEEKALADSNRWEEKRGMKGIIDLLTIKDFRQVQIDVIVAELSLTKLREIGFDVSALSSKAGGASFAGSQAGFPSGPLQLDGGSFANQITNLASASGAFTYFGGPVSVAAAFRLFQNRDAANILAQPKLVIKNGRSGSFLSGGEFPFPAPQSSGSGNQTITVEFRPFGVRLEFMPTITWSNTIDLRIFPEVSDVDPSVGVAVGGVSIPGLRVRRSVSRVEMKENETLVIGGLLDRRVLNDLEKYPFLGDVPVLGTLFRSTRFRNQETELVFAITPHLVRPMAPGSEVSVPVLPPVERDNEMRQVPMPQIGGGDEAEQTKQSEDGIEGGERAPWSQYRHLMGRPANKTLETMIDPKRS